MLLHAMSSASSILDTKYKFDFFSLNILTPWKWSLKFSEIHYLYPLDV